MHSSTFLLRAAGLGCCLAAFAAIGSAQTSVPVPSAPSSFSDDSGLLGKRFVTVDLFTEYFRHLNVDNANGASFGVNLPIPQSLQGIKFDAGLGYSYAEINDRPVLHLTDSQVFGSITAHRRLGPIKPFLGVGVGYDWTHATSFFTSVDDSTGFYDLSGGIEGIVSKTVSLDAALDYVATTESHSSHSWNYTGGVHIWVTPQVCTTFHITLTDDDAITYQLGARFVF